MKYHSNYQYSFKKYILKSKHKATATRLKINQSTNVFITLHSKQKRFFNKVKNYFPCISRVILTKLEYEPLKYSLINAISGRNEKLTIESKLDQGEYHIFTNSNWEYFSELNCSLVISVYSENKIILNDLENGEVQYDFFNQILDSAKENKFCNKVVGKELEYSVYNNEVDIGYYFVAFKNLTEDNIYVQNYQVDYRNLKPMNNIILTDTDKIAYDEESKESLSFKKSGSCFLKKYSEKFHVYELLEDKFNCRFNVGKIEYLIDKETIDKKITDFISNNLFQCEKKEKLGPDLIYYEMETYDGILLIVENTSFFHDYKVKINMKKYQNLQRPLIPYSGFCIKSNRFDYIKLLKKDKNMPIDFVFGYTYRKLT